MQHGFFFKKMFGVHFHTTAPEITFFEEKTWKRFKKSNSWCICPGLYSVKNGTQHFLNKKPVAHSFPDGWPRKSKKNLYARDTI